MTKYCILVNTCDKFEDCWNPFFKLFSLYWPDYDGKIYLNTEYKDYSYPGLNIIPLKVCEKNSDRGNVTWSECLIRALNAIDEDVVLYMQEDYFLKNRVKNDLVEYFGDLIYSHKDIHCIHLTDQAVTATSRSEFDKLNIVARKQRYRVSCQAAFWNRVTLKSYLRSYENAWQFEEFGSRRAGHDDHKFYVVDHTWVKLGIFEIIPYLFTGIVQGRWFEPVQDLFDSHDIKIDYSERGFLNDAPRKPILKKIKYHFQRMSVASKYYYELLVLNQL